MKYGITSNIINIVFPPSNYHRISISDFKEQFNFLGGILYTINSFGGISYYSLRKFIKSNHLLGHKLIHTLVNNNI